MEIDTALTILDWCIGDNWAGIPDPSLSEISQAVHTVVEGYGGYDLVPQRYRGYVGNHLMWEQDPEGE